MDTGWTLDGYWVERVVLLPYIGCCWVVGVVGIIDFQAHFTFFTATPSDQCTLRKLVHFKKGAHANDESLTKVVDFW